MQYHPSYYSSQVQGLLNRFTETIRDLRHVTEPSARRMHLEDLIEVYNSAKAFNILYKDYLNHISQNQLKHILARDLKQWIAFSKPSTESNLITTKTLQ